MSSLHKTPHVSFRNKIAGPEIPKTIFSSNAFLLCFCNSLTFLFLIFGHIFQIIDVFVLFGALVRTFLSLALITNTMPSFIYKDTYHRMP